jgi:hypothetical protein
VFLENQANSTFVLDVVWRFSYQFLKPQNWLKFAKSHFPNLERHANFFLVLGEGARVKSP